MKKLFSFVLAMCMILMLVACGGAEESKAPESQAPASSAPESAAPAAPEKVEWPTENVQIAVPYKAGGGVDKIARLVCAQLEKETGKTFVITNKPEGNGIIAINELMAQEPDGYNLMVVSNRDLFGHMVNQIEGVEYNKESFTYLATLMEGADALFTQTEKYKTFDDLIAYAKENPGKVTVATANTTGLQTLEMINEKLGVEITGVSYSSGADAFADIMGGHVDGAMAALSFYVQGKDNGVAPVLTMSVEKFPIEGLDVACLSDYDCAEAASPMLRFIMGPANMDPALVDAIVAVLDAAYAEGGDLRAAIAAQYDSPNYKTGDALAAFVEENYQMRLDQVSK